MKIFFESNNKHRTGQLSQLYLSQEQIYEGVFLNLQDKVETLLNNLRWER